MRSHHGVALTLGVALFACATTEVSDPPDAARPDSSTSCARDAECDDGRFCNGSEQCRPDAAEADARGCVPAVTPCAATQTCDETADACRADCGLAPDADGDGHEAEDCGGDDCDDGDASRFPGAPETCDAADVDEDCDPTTFGDRDDDRDGFVDVLCCNVFGTARTCGADCDDADPTAHPTEAESCDGVDNDCDGRVDESGGRTFHRDADGDGFGDPAGEVRMACALPPGFVENATDCDDAQAGRNPGLAEICDAIPDNDCNDATHPFDSDGDGYDRPSCGGNDCDDVRPDVHPGRVEICDGLDNDCSTGGGRASGEDADGDGHAPLAALCEGGPLPRDDCNDLAASAHPGATEVCDGIDDDCDGMTDEAPAASLCSGPGTIGRCGSGACVIDSCIGTFRDCNGRTLDGCESDVMIDPVHCGECGFPCAEGGECAGGSCRCPMGTTDCISACVDTRVDPLNCGDCGVRCPSGAVCTLGMCACPSGSSFCGGVCTDTSSDPRNCGACGMLCGAGNSCRTSTCEASPIVQIATGGRESCVVRANGRVACWGRYGAPAAVEIAGFDDVRQLSMGFRHACAVLASGRIRCWGDDRDGAFGDGRVAVGSGAPPPVGPAEVAGITDAIHVAVGGGHMYGIGPISCATRGTGAVSCWGTGALGRPGTTLAITPLGVPGIAGALSSCVGAAHVCVLRDDGRIACWGRNGYGEVGVATSPVESPVLVPGISDAVEVSCGALHTCVRRASGAVTCFGDGFGGGLFTVTEAAGASAISAGTHHTCALLPGGVVRCWGRNGSMQLGAGSTATDTSAAPVPGLGTAAAVSAGGDHSFMTGLYSHSCALVGASVSCWGANADGQVGITPSMSVGAPTVVPGI